ncbi:MAG: hypothetical protein WAW39_30590 [Prosthecobacter sp.]|uniref:hypothetical protein n=1 Tax=Prosthecobacter sp. TaxID=1965333 RepID=UPI003BAE95FA
MNPTEKQLLPVLSIDLGASYTKLAWRERWEFDPQRSNPQNRFTSPSVPIKIDGAFLVPSIVLDPGEGREWQFGNDAALSTPGPSARLFRNWKATLFDADTTEQEVAQDSLVAKSFFGWLKDKLRRRYRVGEALVRVCVPEFDPRSQEIGVCRLLDALEGAGWARSQLLVVAEPKANVLGLASKGRNHVNVFPDTPPIAFLRSIFDPNSPLICAAKKATAGGFPIKLVTIDIGAFTTDIAVCLASSEIKVECQYSYKHGVAALDNALQDLIRAGGVDPSNLPHSEFEIGKRTVYGGEASQWAVGNRSATLEENCMDVTIAKFTDDLLQMCQTETSGAHWFVVTGGGGEIPLILNRIRSKLEAGGLRYVQELFPDLDQRIATALGGASVVLDFSDFGDSSGNPQQPYPMSSVGRPCECAGANKECVKCQGTGWLTGFESVAKLRSGDRQPLAEFVPTGKPSRPEDEVLPKRVLRNVTPKPSNGGLAPGSKPPNILEPDERIDVSEIVECLRGQESKVTQQFGLEGWMGQLVFGAEQWSAESRRRILQDHSSATGKAAWLRLLCLGTCLGVRAQPRYIKSFWENKLPEIWRVLIPTDLDQLEAKDYERKLNDVFVNAIHREFNDMRATGEDAELWRRIFYDFRKLHHFVYLNDLPCSLLELARQPGLPANALVNFLKSGFLPSGNKRWVGAIGQSMTAPLLFLMRELRRLAMIDARFDASCFYMNSPARRVARQLKWISESESTWFDIESLVEMSRTCHERMNTEMPELLPFFDLPLQWFAFNNSR